MRTDILRECWTYIERAWHGTGHLESAQYILWLDEEIKAKRG